MTRSTGPLEKVTVTVNEEEPLNKNQRLPAVHNSEKDHILGTCPSFWTLFSDFRMTWGNLVVANIVFMAEYI